MDQYGRGRRARETGCRCDPVSQKTCSPRIGARTSLLHETATIASCMQDAARVGKCMYSREKHLPLGDDLIPGSMSVPPPLSWAPPEIRTIVPLLSNCPKTTVETPQKAGSAAPMLGRAGKALASPLAHWELPLRHVVQHVSLHENERTGAQCRLSLLSCAR